MTVGQFQYVKIKNDILLISLDPQSQVEAECKVFHDKSGQYNQERDTSYDFSISLYTDL